MKRVLSIAGGGMRGVGPLKICFEIEKRVGRPLFEIFDLIVGTSTGGIVACLAGAGKTAEESKKFYYDHGPKIFSSNPLSKIGSGGGLLGTKYSSDNLINSLQACIGSVQMRDAKTRVMVTAMTDQRKAEMVKSWDSEWENCPLAIAALMTASAQTYFPPACILHQGEVVKYLDGGNVRNSPQACAAFEALRLWRDLIDLEGLFLLHLGTGKAREPKPLPKGGALSWAPCIFDFTTQADDSYDDYFCRGLSEIIPRFRYERLDFTLQKFPAMDDARASTLDNTAAAAWQSVLADWNRFEKNLELLK